jgi:hypothetical protein
MPQTIPEAEASNDKRVERCAADGDGKQEGDADRGEMAVAGTLAAFIKAVGVDQRQCRRECGAGLVVIDDDDIEPVTRIWITLDEDNDEVVLEFAALLVGFGADDEPYVLDPQTLADAVAELEAFRPGLARPVLR